MFLLKVESMIYEGKILSMNKIRRGAVGAASVIMLLFPLSCYITV